MILSPRYPRACPPNVAPEAVNCWAIAVVDYWVDAHSAARSARSPPVR